MYNELTYVIEQDSRDIKMATVINNFTIWIPTIIIQLGVYSAHSLTVV